MSIKRLQIGFEPMPAPLNWVSNRGAYIDACLSGDVTRSFRLHDIKPFVQFWRDSFKGQRLAASSCWCSPSPSTERWAEIARQILPSTGLVAFKSSGTNFFSPKRIRNFLPNFPLVGIFSTTLTSLHSFDFFSDLTSYYPQRTSFGQTFKKPRRLFLAFYVQMDVSGYLALRDNEDDYTVF